MSKKNILNVHQALMKKELRDAEKRLNAAEFNLRQTFIQETIDKRVTEAITCRTVAILLALRQKGWGKTRADWLVNTAYEIEQLVITGEETWENLISKMFEEYGYEEGEFGYNESGKRKE